MSGTTMQIAEWVCALRYEDIPERVHDRTKAQIMSVVAACHASRHLEGAHVAVEAARDWGRGSEATVLMTGERLPRHQAIFANACTSVALDFDDYLFAGHTGHSAVCVPLAYAQTAGMSGRDLLCAATIANEVGGRLGASLLFGPHNGQMWAYIHLIGAACAAARLRGLDADRTAHAIGIAFTQPVHPLMPAFMGPDSKMLLPASTSVDGARAADLAARGWTGSQVILEDSQGFLRRFNPEHMGWMLSGLGRAWLSDSLTYKIVPGCAYIDTSVDAMREILAGFERSEGRSMQAGDVRQIDVRCGLYTSGMEALCMRNRLPGTLPPISVNFSVALSFGLMLQAGDLAPEYLSHAYLDANRVAVEQLAERVRVQHDPEMDRRASEAGEQRGFSLRDLLRSQGAGEPSLRDVSFEGYTMSFPAEVTVTTTGDRRLTASQDVPLGGAGRPWTETYQLVTEKLRASHTGGRAAADEAIRAIDSLQDVGDINDVVELLCP